MQKLIKKLSFSALIALAFCLVSQSVWAVPAQGNFRTVMQPDGTSLQVSLRGDEWFHWQENEKREIVVFNQNSGYMEYATVKVMMNGKKALVPSGIIATENGLSSDKTMQKGTQFQFVAPTNNDIKAMWGNASAKKNLSVPYKRTK